MIYSTKDYCVKCGKMNDACTCEANKVVAGWRCKECKGTFDTMAAMKYHKCEPVKFQRPGRP